jgi:actin-related protein 3
MVSSEHTTPVAVVISPIQDRMRLFANIMLHGGSTTFSGLARRLRADVQTIVDADLRANAETASKKLGREVKAELVPVKIVEHKRQQYAVWYGGGMPAITGKAFYNQCLTKQAYSSPIFGESAV